MMSTPSDGRQTSLRQLTRSTLEDILGFSGEQTSSDWSVLIYDDFAMGLIAPILKVGDLRKMGITLFMKLSAPREAVSDAPAIYICQPTEDAVKRIAKDCINDMYRSYNIHWTSPISIKLLELLACEMLPKGSITNIKVKDQFLNFIAPVGDMFSLNVPDSYYTLNSLTTTEEQLDEHLDRCAEGVVHVLLTLQMIPILAWPKENVACAALQQKLKSKLKDMKHYLPHAEVNRPVLLLSGRESDLSTGLVQPFTYRAMLHDTLHMNVNKISLQNKEYEVDEADPIWQDISGDDYEDVIPKVQEMIATMSNEKASKPGNQADLDEQTKALMKSLETASSFTERKRSLETHLALCVSLGDEVKKNDLSTIHGLADDMIFNSKFDHDKIREICLSEKLSLPHRMRLALVYSMITSEKNEKVEKAKSLEERITELAKKTDADPDSIEGKYYRAYKCMHNQQQSNFKERAHEKNTKGFFNTRKIGDFVKNIASGGPKLLPHTRLIDAILRRGDNSKPIIDELEFYDPKTSQQVDPTPLRFNQALVFIMGGGNYVEYEDLKKWEKQDDVKGKSVIYGTTQIVSGTEMLKQMAHLGVESTEMG
eukprot:TRINITY_DN511_c4_g1_i1.p1 TRINITY_DN511_c4_g1~~TRINITY_DN511_c4_g1_i1.p1  ORF type:complete len:596 (+),score=113.09 TRINITY_DN511_c4_g1_i1:84-1871(+)